MIVLTPALLLVLLSPAPSGNPPSIETSHDSDSGVVIGTTYRFTVTASDVDGDLVGLLWLNPLPGDLELRRSGAGSRQTLEITWAVKCAGSFELLFRALDATGSASVAKVHLRTVGAAPATPCVLADVTGDDRVDFIAGSSLAHKKKGAIYVWESSTGQEGDPDYFLQVPGAHRLAYSNIAVQGIQCVDVTADGVADVIAATEYGVQGSEIHLWSGAALQHQSGPISPTATLRVPGGGPGSMMFRTGEIGVTCVDLTGDGLLDIVTAGVTNEYHITRAGAIYLWAGLQGGWTGTVTPTATLAVPTASTDDRLGIGYRSYPYPVVQGIRILDVTGDGRADVVAAAPMADVGGKIDVGAAYVWSGAGPMTGMVPPLASLYVPEAVDHEQLGNTDPARLYCQDLTGDSIPDIVLGALLADQPGKENTGAIYVWEGGSSLAGTPAYRARLYEPAGLTWDRLSEGGLWFGDLTGDGLPDVITQAPHADVGGEVDRGAYYVFAAGAGLVGDVEPRATIGLPGYLAEDSRSTVADVSGDGLPDLVISYYDAPSGTEGEIHVLLGGPSLTGMPAPDAILTLGLPHSGDALGLRGLDCRDFDGDGILDVLAASSRIDVDGVSDVGGVVTFSGGPGILDGTGSRALLTLPGGKTYDAAFELLAILPQDVTGDGIRDLIASATDSSFSGVHAAGSYLVWAGGAQPNGVVAPTARIGAIPAVTNEQVGHRGTLVFDVSGDGVADLLCSSPRRWVNGVPAAGGVYLWKGGQTLSGHVTQTEVLFGYGISPYDFLGGMGGTFNLRIGVLVSSQRYDILAGVSSKNLFGLRDVGAVFVWVGGLSNHARKRYAVSYADQESRFPWVDYWYSY